MRLGAQKSCRLEKPTNGEAPAKQKVVEKSITKEAFLEKNSIENSNSNEINFLQIRTNLKNKNGLKSKSLLKLNSSFRNHAEIVRRINSMNLGWTAKTYDNIHDKTLGEMNNMYGKYNPSKVHDDFRFKSKTSSFNSEDNFYNNFYFSSGSKKIFIFLNFFR